MFFIIYSFWSIQFVNVNKFSSPDETANYFFSKHYALNQAFKVDNIYSQNGVSVVHPRSAFTINGYLVPIGFLGLPLLYGILSILFGTNILLFLTPLFVVVAGVFFFYLIRNIFAKYPEGDTIAWVSYFLFFIHPAVWCYTSRSMYPNMLFIAFLIMGLFFLQRLLSSETQSFKNWIWYGVFMGLALIVRTSEIVWLGIILIFCLFMIQSLKNKLPHVLLGIGIISLIFLPIFYYNSVLYGNWYMFGYSAQSSSNINGQEVSLAQSFEPQDIWFNFYNYFIKLFWWLFVLFLAGFIFWFYKYLKTTSRSVLYQATGWITVILWLVIFYGSMIIKDTLSKELVTMGTSYVRYWLPLYIMTIPFIAIAIARFALLFEKVANIKAVITVVLILLFGVSSYAVLYKKPEGLLQVKRAILDDYHHLIQAKELIEKNSIVVSEKADKIFFPEFDVIINQGIMTLRDKAILKQLQTLVSQKPVYYYHSLTNADILFLNKNILQNYGLQLASGYVLSPTVRLDRIEVKSRK